MELGSAGVVNKVLLVNHVDDPLKYSYCLIQSLIGARDRRRTSLMRHSTRDRLGATEYPADMVDAIAGWTAEGIGHEYGKWRNLKSMSKNSVMDFIYLSQSNPNKR